MNLWSDFHRAVGHERGSASVHDTALYHRAAIACLGEPQQVPLPREQHLRVGKDGATRLFKFECSQLLLFAKAAQQGLRTFGYHAVELLVVLLRRGQKIRVNHVVLQHLTELKKRRRV